jgi:uncharacterized protein with PIN domain
LPKNASHAPEFVPAKDEKRLNTPYGLLLNELSRSPEQVIASTLRMLKLALALDTGMYFESQDDIILYVMRFACRVLSFVNFILLHEQSPLYRNRDMPVSQATLQTLQQGYDDLSDLLDHKFLPMLHTWIHECLARAEQLQEEARKKAESLNEEAARLNNVHKAAGMFKEKAEAEDAQAAMMSSRRYGQQFNNMGGFNMGGNSRYTTAPTAQERKRKEKKEARNDFDALYVHDTLSSPRLLLLCCARCLSPHSGRPLLASTQV